MSSPDPESVAYAHAVLATTLLDTLGGYSDILDQVAGFSNGGFAPAQMLEMFDAVREEARFLTVALATVLRAAESYPEELLPPAGVLTAAHMLLPSLALIALDAELDSIHKVGTVEPDLVRLQLGEPERTWLMSKVDAMVPPDARD